MLTFVPSRKTNFPLDDYTPYGYLYTPKHTGTHPDGILRSVPPLGFGLWRRGLKWYGMDALNSVNAYLSLLLPSIRINDVLLAEVEDFEKEDVKLVSRYHSSNIMSYDFEAEQLKVTLAWFSDGEGSLLCRVAMENQGDKEAQIAMDATHVYGMNDRRWWGSDAITARYVAKEHAMVSKILAYGDVFALSADLQANGGVVAESLEKLDAHRRNGEPLSGEPISTKMPGPLCASLEWCFSLMPKETKLFTIALSRAVNEKEALSTVHNALANGDQCLNTLLDEDDNFCATMPTLREDWPDHWRRGMVYHYQTLRMNVFPATDRFKHKWDGMQTVNPRMVLGETCIDMLSLRYADLDTALEVLTTTFVDSPDVYVPCCREDGSVNMIGTDGSECATAIMWGFPWRTIKILLAESGNVAWLRQLYPHLKKCIAWWQENRTDNEGWYHCNNSWESGQDGSKRFVTGEDDSCPEGMNANHVRAVDLESTMAQTAGIMAEFAALLGEAEDEAYYQAMHDIGVERVRKMFFDDRFRDVNAITGQPFMADAHDDAMLTMPLNTAQATDEQVEKMQWILDEFIEIVDAHEYLPSCVGVFWPPILQTLSESFYQCGREADAANVVATLADTTWKRDDHRKHWSGKHLNGIPERFCINIPGNARENLSDDIETSGAENYGWGCISIALFGETILGIRPVDLLGQKVTFRPIIPSLVEGKTFMVEQFPMLGTRVTLTFVRDDNSVQATIKCSKAISVVNKAGEELASGKVVSFTVPNDENVVLSLK